jgi:hypothetical protein
MRTGKGSGRKTRAFALILAGILWAGWVPAAQAQGGIPEELRIADEFEAGIGAPVGTARLVQGRVVATHAEDGAVGFALSAGNPVFQGDTIFTGDDGKVNIELNDGSRITLATRTQMAIDKSVFNPDRLKTRMSFVRVLVGKVRFLVEKFSGMVSSEFKVKTSTAIIGVRGSDFAVEATEERTRVTAFENTRIEVVGLVDLCPGGSISEDCGVTPTLIEDFEQALVRLGDFPRMMGELPVEEIELIRNDFTMETAPDPLTEGPVEPEIRVPESELDNLTAGTAQVNEEMAVPDAVAAESGDGGGETAEAEEMDTEEVETSEDLEMDDLEMDDLETDTLEVNSEQADAVREEELKQLPYFPGVPGSSNEE